jgi:cell wall-associated protease
MKLNNGLYAFVSIAALALAARSAHSSVIAIVDSGTDVTHPEIAAKIWNNPGELDDGIDNDDNGYVDDLHGWNFIDNDNKLIDRKLIGTFPDDDFKYFDIQTKALMGVATADEIAWIKAKIQDTNFVAGLEAFGNFVHGTHVAGISARNADKAQLMILKTIGTPTPLGQSFIGFMNQHQAELASAMSATDGGGTEDKLVKAGLDALASAQGKGVAAPGAYLALEKPRVANCSWGASSAAIKPLLKQIIEGILHDQITDAQLDGYVSYFLNKTVAAMGDNFITPSPGTLFVIAAGNDGTDNDATPAAPANVKADNTIAVAATLNRTRLASFSNFGSTTVEIAAPGVGIKSTIPGGQEVQLSGTSQAAPYVTNIAGLIIDANPALSPGEVKQILMGTVDKKDWLAGKVVSGGIANPDRAVYAAQLTTGMDLSAAIEKANTEVADYQSLSAEDFSQEQGNFVLPLPSFIR